MNKDSNQENWSLVANEDLEEIRLYLLSLVPEGEKVTSETDLGRVIHTLDSGINSTNSVPSDFENLPMLKHFDEFVGAMRYQLEMDDGRWGDTYLNKPREGQEMRIKDTIDNYFFKWEFVERDINWLAIVGNAYIAWLRETHPEMSKLWIGGQND